MTADPAAQHQAQQLIAAINEVYAAPTSYRDPSPLPTVGATPPVPQPGRPPMSQKATDASALMLSAGVASLPLGAAAALVLWASGQADPVSLAIGASAPIGLVLAIGALLRGLKGDRTDHHHHYTGTVQQQHTNINNHGIWAKTNNNQ